jgi:hypothetical protein
LEEEKEGLRIRDRSKIADAKPLQDDVDRATVEVFLRPLGISLQVPTYLLYFVNTYWNEVMDLGGFVVLLS